MKDKKYRKVRDHCHNTEEYRGAAHSICDLKHSVPKGISIDFHNGSNDDYHFIIKLLTEEFEKQLTCLHWKHWKIHNLYSSNKKQITRIEKNGEEITENISYRLFIDSTRYMAGSLLNIVNNFSKRIHKFKSKYGHDDKKCETCRISCIHKL